MKQNLNLALNAVPGRGASVDDSRRCKELGTALVVEQAQRQVQTFFDELKNGTLNYRTVASLGGQIAQEYRGRCILELLQNAHDALAKAGPGEPRRITFVLRTSPEPELLIGNSGGPFQAEDFAGICQLGQSPKDPNESVGNKGLGFRSVLEVCTCPEVWSTAPPGGSTSFVFQFDPAVSDVVADAAHELEDQGLAARSPFDPARSLVDWSQEQLGQYRERLSSKGLDAAREARAFLSPYLVPLPIEGTQPEVERLLQTGHVTVVRLRLDGGRTGDIADAVQSVRDQLTRLDARSTIFLPHLEVLVIEIDGVRRTLERLVDSDETFSTGARTRQQQLLVGRDGPGPGEQSTCQFRVWTRAIGGDEDPGQAERLRLAVEHLPNRWPEVRRVTLGVAVEDAPAAEDGVFVIFLPTEMTTGTGAHINAPFYGSLDRRQINFDDPYNKLLLECVLDLCLDVATGLVSAPAEGWRARAVVDLLASTETVGGKPWRLVDRVSARAGERGLRLVDMELVLCDEGWSGPADARLMPDIPENTAVTPCEWREHAEFDVVSAALDGRRTAVRELLTTLGGSLTPTPREWRATLEQMASQVQSGALDVTWDGFLESLVAALPAALLSTPKSGAADPLGAARFLPTQDGRLISAADTAKLFFQPVRGADDAADLVGDVPRSLERRVAFLHPDVRTQEGPQRRNTAVQRFLDERFARGFRREDLLRDVVVAALPPLPAQHGSPDGDLCRELFSWTLKLLGRDEPETLVPLLKRLPVACHGGWFAMSDTVFGPGWAGHLGEHLWLLADELPEDAAARVRRAALLPPEDARWGLPVQDRAALFHRAGVVDGLRLESTPEVRFHTSGYGRHELPAKLPVGTPPTAWNAWRTAVHAEAKPYYDGWFEYGLTGIDLLPELHHIDELSTPARDALSRLLLASLEHWPRGWEFATITKIDGNAWSRRITSPLKYWMATLPWLSDKSTVERPVSGRWLVPESLLLGQPDRFAHLDPLALTLARELQAEPDLKAALCRLGLNVYPVEDDKTGPALLDALAASWRGRRVPPRRFDVFLGQVRDGWRHLDPAKGLPKSFLVRTGRRSFSALAREELAEVYLPDNRDRTRSLREHGKHILEMHAADASRMAEPILESTGIRRASALDERFLVDGVRWTGAVDGAVPLDETGYAWLPAVILTVAAHGGVRPAGAATKAWRDAADALRRAHVLECESIAVQLVDEEDVVASSEPEAQWLPGDVLAIRRDTELAYESLAPAAQAMLGRQDLVKDLRLVLGALAGHAEPTPQQIESAVERAEIDAQALADVRHQWAGTTSVLVDRIRPVLTLLDIPGDGLDAAATDVERLTEWLSSNLAQWPVAEVLSAARQSRDDRAMGEAAWRALGEVAQLPAWNRALAALGERYAGVENRGVQEQVAAHLDAATSLLRAFARHAALEADQPEMFHEVEAVTQSFEVPDDWATRWWDVPLEAVLDALRARYAEVVGDALVGLLDGARTIANLRDAFHARGIQTEPNPYETASLNKDRLDSMVARLHDIHRAWAELSGADPVTSEPPKAPADLGASAYLHRWSDAELVNRALRVLGDAAFLAACDGCATLDEIRDRLGIDPAVVDARRQERLRREREAERQRRTFNVAGAPFEVGAANYGELFEHLCGLAAPEGPCASEDEFTPLANARAGGGGSGAGGGKGGKTSHRRPPAELRELVGVVGEMHAYRFLRTQFGNDAVTRDAWVSETRLKVLPPVPGERDATSDGYGFDFKFRHRGRTWHIEVKATQGEDPQFDLGISEIEAASRLARSRSQPWRILRVGNALSDQPTFEWLPNPFQEGFRKHFRLRKGGMMVSYARKKS